jgi:hypothetical protein
MKELFPEIALATRPRNLLTTMMEFEATSSPSKVPQLNAAAALPARDWQRKNDNDD